MTKAYHTSLGLEIGRKFPLSAFVLKDSSIFSLDKYKGKAICLVLLASPAISIKYFKSEIEKFTKEEVEFVFATLPRNVFNKNKVDSALLRRRNVSLIELADPDIKSKLLIKQTKIFMLDKWFRIRENNAEDPINDYPIATSYEGSTSRFELSLRKTIDAKRYSKAEKTAMLKTAGWIFGSVLLTALIGFWIYRIRIARIRQQEAVRRRIKELEIKAIRSQMNPHFIFNALNSIQSLINGNQFKESNIYLSKFAVLLRGVLNNSEKSRVSLSDELESVRLYCELEQLRFEFKFEILIDPQVNSDLIEIPGMIIQPLAENAIVHGLSAKGAEGILMIRVDRKNDHLCVCVSDNGVGLSPQVADTLSQKGFGLKLVEERINILNLDGKEARLTVENRKDTTGTIATLTLPID
jgi:two-component sensor histidine kinase